MGTFHEIVPEVSLPCDCGLRPLLCSPRSSGGRQPVLQPERPTPVGLGHCIDSVNHLEVQSSTEVFPHSGPCLRQPVTEQVHNLVHNLDPMMSREKRA